MSEPIVVLTESTALRLRNLLDKSDSPTTPQGRRPERAKPLRGPQIETIEILEGDDGRVFDSGTIDYYKGRIVVMDSDRNWSYVTPSDEFVRVYPQEQFSIPTSRRVVCVRIADFKEEGISDPGYFTVTPAFMALRSVGEWGVVFTADSTTEIEDDYTAYGRYPASLLVSEGSTTNFKFGGGTTTTTLLSVWAVPINQDALGHNAGQVKGSTTYYGYFAGHYYDDLPVWHVIPEASVNGSTQVPGLFTDLRVEEIIASIIVAASLGVPGIIGTSDQYLGGGTKEAAGWMLDTTETSANKPRWLAAPSGFVLSGVNSGKGAYFGRYDAPSYYTHPYVLMNADLHWIRTGATGADTNTTNGYISRTRTETVDSLDCWTIAHNYYNNGSTDFIRSFFAYIRRSGTAFMVLPSVGYPGIIASNYVQAKNGFVFGEGPSAGGSPTAFVGITDTDALGNKFAGGIFYEKGSTTLAPIATSGSASDLSTGTVPAGRMPALTGDVTTTAGTVATTVAKIRGVNVNTTSPSSGQVLGYNGTDWIPTTPSSTPSGVAGGDLVGTYPNPTVATNKITYAKIQKVTANRLLGNPTGSLADVTDIGVTGLLSFSGGNLTAAVTGSTGTKIDGSAVTNGLTTTIGTGLTDAQATLGANQNIFIGPGYTNTGPQLAIPTNGRYKFDGKARLYLDALAGPAWITTALFRNGVLIANSGSIMLVPVSTQITVPLRSPKQLCNATDVISARCFWNGGPVGVAQILTDANGQTEFEATRTGTI